MVKILPRGNWLDKSGEEVKPAIPSFLGTLETGDKRASRMDLAKWVVSKENPLTSRAFVNRAWKLFFGYGLSRRLDDLGGQGEPPTHPELLDYLAADFRDNGWDVKRLVKLMVTSGAYRQSSAVSAKLSTKIPPIACLPAKLVSAWMPNSCETLPCPLAISFRPASAARA